MKTYSLFIYGSLCAPALRRHLLGRDVEVENAWLTGYRAYYLKHQIYPGLRRAAGAVTPGLLILGLSHSEMRRLDAYEGELYDRHIRVVRQGFRRSRAWVYSLRASHRSQLSKRLYQYNERATGLPEPRD